MRLRIRWGWRCEDGANGCAMARLLDVVQDIPVSFNWHCIGVRADGKVLLYQVNIREALGNLCQGREQNLDLEYHGMWYPG